MLQAPFCNRLAWVAAALMVVALPGAHSAFAAASPAQMLSAQLPPGVSLARASVGQTAGALHEAVAKSPGSAVGLTEAAIAAKSGKKGGLSCGGVRSLVEAATSAAPDRTREIVEAAMAMKPDCNNELTSLLNRDRGDGGPLGSVGEGPSDAATGFGAGLGSGFPGSPGFIGSAPSGAFAFPSFVVGPLTPTTNR